MTKKAKTKKTPRAHSAKPARGEQRALKPSHPAAHAKSHVDHVQIAPIAAPEPKAHAKSEPPPAPRRGLLSRVVTLVLGVTEALLPKRFPMRKPAH